MQEAVPSNPTTTNKTKKPRLGFILSSKFKKSKSKNRSGAISSLGLMDGNSTNTVNTVEDTEDSTNANDKIKVTAFTSHDEVSFDIIIRNSWNDCDIFPTLLDAIIIWRTNFDSITPSSQ